jgi:hypothetical protein
MTYIIYIIYILYILYILYMDDFIMPAMDQFLLDVGNKLQEITAASPGIILPVGQERSYCAALIMRDILVKEMQKVRDEKADMNEDIWNAQEKYFQSEQFLHNLVSGIPLRRRATDSKHSLTIWVNTLLHTLGTGWREGIEKGSPPQKQCKNVLCIKNGTGRTWPWKYVDTSKKPFTLVNFKDMQSGPQWGEISTIQRDPVWGEFPCYICGRPLNWSIKDNLEKGATVECEHILAIVSALMNYDLALGDQTDYTEPQLRRLAEEYDLAHKCCNQVKSNIDMIMLSLDFKYIFNRPGTIDMLTEIGRRSQAARREQRLSITKRGDGKDSMTNDCGELQNVAMLQGPPENLIPNVPDRAAAIAVRLEKLITDINNNLNIFKTQQGTPEENQQLYEMYGKFKVILALYRPHIWQAMAGGGDYSVILKMREAARTSVEKKIKTLKAELETNKRDLITAAFNLKSSYREGDTPTRRTAAASAYKTKLEDVQHELKSNLKIERDKLRELNKEEGITEVTEPKNQGDKRKRGTPTLSAKNQNYNNIDALSDLSPEISTPKDADLDKLLDWDNLLGDGPSSSATAPILDVSVPLSVMPDQVYNDRPQKRQRQGGGGNGNIGIPGLFGGLGIEEIPVSDVFQKGSDEDIAFFNKHFDVDKEKKIISNKPNSYKEANEFIAFRFVNACRNLIQIQIDTNEDKTLLDASCKRLFTDKLVEFSKKINLLPEKEREKLKKTADGKIVMNEATHNKITALLNRGQEKSVKGSMAGHKTITASLTSKKSTRKKTTPRTHTLKSRTHTPKKHVIVIHQGKKRHKITVPHGSTINEVKNELFSITGLPPENQRLFPGKSRQKYTDDTRLTELGFMPNGRMLLMMSKEVGKAAEEISKTLLGEKQTRKSPVTKHSTLKKRTVTPSKSKTRKSKTPFSTLFSRPQPLMVSGGFRKKKKTRKKKTRKKKTRKKKRK